MSSDSAPARALLTFIVTVLAWVVGLFALFRLPMVQQFVLIPYATIQQGIAVALFGVSPTAIIVDVSCTGSDALALALGAVLGFPATWKQRLRAAAAGFLLITVLNTLRIATLSMVAGMRAPFDLLHLYVWPGVIVLAAVLYVFFWMRSVPPYDSLPLASTDSRRNSARSVAASGADTSSDLARPAERATRSDARGIDGFSGWRFATTASVLVAGYFAASPWILSSATLQTASVWSARAARSMIAGMGVSSSVTNNVLIAGNHAWAITPECIVTPLIPVYLATVICWPTSARRRGIALALAPLLFFSLGVVRLLVLALPASLAVHTVALHAFYQVALALLLVAFAARFNRTRPDESEGRLWRRGALAIGLGAIAVIVYSAGVVVMVRPLAGLLHAALPHLGHGYVDGQGALLILPAFQAGLFSALWVAGGKGRQPARMLGGLAVLAVQQLGIVMVLGELHAHAGFELPVVAIRAYAILVPVVLVWLLRRDHSMLRGPLPAPDAVLLG